MCVFICPFAARPRVNFRNRPGVCEIREKEDAWVENFNPPPRRARSDVYLLAALRTQIRNNLRNWTRLGPFAVLDGSSGALGDKIFN
jgi:hypothetical protein